MKSSLRDFSEKMPQKGICALCNLLLEDCKCTKYYCKCKITALSCEWPLCTCIKCLELNPMCECKND